MAQKEPIGFQVNPRVYQSLCNFLASLYVVTELPKINAMIADLQNGTRAIYPPEPEQPPAPEQPPKTNGKGDENPALESVGKEN